MSWPSTKVIATFLVAAALIAGCGNGETDPSGEEESVVQIHFEASGSGEIEEDTSLNLLDVRAPSFITDSVTNTCAFTTPANTNGSDADHDIDIDTGASPTGANCTSPNGCIFCTTSASGSNCSISCDGMVPSNEATDADKFLLTLTVTSAISTDMPSPVGAVRVDAQVSDIWPSMDMDAPGGMGAAVNIDLCNGGTGEMSLGGGNPLQIDTATDTTFKKGYTLDDVTGTCTITITMKAWESLSGAISGGSVGASEGATITLDAGTVYLNTRICDAWDTTETLCPPP